MKKRKKRVSRQLSTKNDRMLFGGRKPLLEVLQNPNAKVQAVYASPLIANSNEYDFIKQTCKDRGIALHQVGLDHIEGLLHDVHHQGVAFQMDEIPTMDFDELLTDDRNFGVVALDHVQDPMNLGSIIRSAHAFGVKAVICPKDNSAPVSRITVKASAGAALFTPVIYVTNLSRALSDLKEVNFWAVGLDVSKDSKPLQEIDAGKRWVLVAGSEGKGMRPLVKKQLDFVATIPMKGTIESLNVSQACAVALYSLNQSSK